MNNRTNGRTVRRKDRRINNIHTTLAKLPGSSPGGTCNVPLPILPSMPHWQGIPYRYTKLAGTGACGGGLMTMTTTSPGRRQHFVDTALVERSGHLWWNEQILRIHHYHHHRRRRQRHRPPALFHASICDAEVDSPSASVCTNPSSCSSTSTCLSSCSHR